MISATKIQKVLESYTHLQLFLYLCNQIRKSFLQKRRGDRHSQCEEDVSKFEIMFKYNSAVIRREIGAKAKCRNAETPINTGVLGN